MPELGALSNTSGMLVQGGAPPDLARITIDSELLKALPIEIFSVILSLATSTSGKPPRKISAILDVALVCRAWLDAVFSEPSIWTSFEVNFGAATEARLNEILPIIRRWYGRSGGLPLELFLEASSIHPSQVLLPPLVDFILSIDRWETLALTTWIVFPGQRLFQNLVNAAFERRKESNSLRGLRHFKVVPDSREFSSLQTSTIQRLAQLAPQLEAVRLLLTGSIDLTRIPPALSSNKALVHLDLRSYGTQGGEDVPLLSLLLLCIPTLQSLVLSVYRQREFNGTHRDQRIVEYPNLKSLQLTFHYMAAIELIELGMMKCPNLEDLHLNFDMRSGLRLDSSSHSKIVRMLANCPRLKSFRALELRLSTEELLGVLPKLPALQCLQLWEIYNYPWSDGRLFEKLFELSQTSRLWPDLQEISVRHPASASLAAAFVKFVEDPKRWPGDGPVEGSFTTLKTAAYHSGTINLLQDQGASIPGFPYRRGKETVRSWWSDIGLRW